MVQNKNSVKTAGFTYIIIILLGMVKVVLVDTRLIVSDNTSETIVNINAQQLIYNLGIISDLLMYSLVILLSYSLFRIVKDVNKNIASLAFLFRFGEAILGVVVTMFGGLLPIYLIKRQELTAMMEFQQILTVLFELRVAGLDIILFFVGVGGVLFFILFLIARLIPVSLSVWGIITYVSMIFISLLNILLPEKLITLESVLFASGALFELVIGFWFIFKGINSTSTNPA
ncbi:MAG: hypothetical protein SCALA702_04550 [Melioribacteraceae bacterium]|nr:MAG: hypothetical protein SCALA702_04550 [Melioribacteraceae bacterium]